MDYVKFKNPNIPSPLHLGKKFLSIKIVMIIILILKNSIQIFVTIIHRDDSILLLHSCQMRMINGHLLIVMILIRRSI